jgi:rhodanese-related sulfurtransferase
MKRLSRVSLIVTISLLVGLIFNFLHPKGINWKILIPLNIYERVENDSTVQIISADSAYVLWKIGETKFIDIRMSEEYELDHIKGAVNISIDKISELDPHQLSNATIYIIYDQEGDSGKLSRFARHFSLITKKTVFILFGGYFSWLGKQYPIEVQ